MSTVAHLIRAVELVGAVGVSLSLLSLVGKKSLTLAMLGDAFVIVSFALLGYVLMRVGKLWTGLAFALSATWQIASIAQNAYRKRRTARGVLGE